MKQGLISELEMVRDFLKRSISCLNEQDSDFVPKEGMLSVSQQVAHIAQVVDWFLEGASREEGFCLNFESHWVEVNKCKSLSKAIAWFDESINAAIRLVDQMSVEHLKSALPEGPVMGGAPRFSIVGSISDHTAHHRGALTVYSRLLGKIPKMPYMDEV